MSDSRSSTPDRPLPESSPLRERELVVVSNREPYVHSYSTQSQSDSSATSAPSGDDPEISVERSTGGLTTALDPVLQRLGGTWVAWGSGDADAAVADDGTVGVPPDEPAYDLERVFLEESTVEDYYYGYSNSTLWPLCHGDLGRIRSEPSHWPAYVRANERFADAVLESVGSGLGPGTEAPSQDPIVWIQDYHFALLGDRLRGRLPDSAVVAQFWHVPWPSPDDLRVSPNATALLEGLLATDLLGFHLEEYRRNFLESVDRLLPSASVDREAGTVRYVADDGQQPPSLTRVYAQPIGIDASGVRDEAMSPAVSPESVRADYNLAPSDDLLLGVERLDYAKGIRKRLRAFEHLLETRPEWRGAVTHLMVSTPSREGIPEYEIYSQQVRERVAAVNDRFGTDDWTPVRHVAEPVDWERLLALYRAADALVVSSRRDGLNLVAMEYVAANASESGAVVGSEFAGVNDLFEGSIEINPYDVCGTATEIDRALQLDPDDQHDRLRSMWHAVQRNDVGEWVRRLDRELAAHPSLAVTTCEPDADGGRSGDSG
ncbi:alpha,alpha-trehalose-phosphate synthase (UDP-forming) [Halobiforma nitratireducens]|uniref:Trehalose-6-phosphate synthase n=1 Tax=Halobiforma nitratireducens JCM 10879 TaxID=1227454 RepID=M0M7U2_9EURY|nr:trehalose-6-phosphate synthase [Halobiforma nitratireducens]EMA41796.1 trehalose-6-phosphate synthase [Halobiforma nitratireducens JCM 10879]